MIDSVCVRFALSALSLHPGGPRARVRRRRVLAGRAACPESPGFLTGAHAGRTPPMTAPFRTVALLAGGILLAFLALPLVALLVRVPAGDWLGRLGEAPVRDALALSVTTSLSATAIVVLLGPPLAYRLALHPPRGQALVLALIDLPMVLPPTVAGVALLLAFGRVGLAGRALAGLGISLPFTTLAVVMAQVFM